MPSLKRLPFGLGLAHGIGGPRACLSFPTILTDPVTGQDMRWIEDDGYMDLDLTLTATGFAGIKDTDWETVEENSIWVSQYTAIWDTLTTKPDDANAIKQNLMVKTLVDGGVWDKLDRFFYFAQTTNDDGEALIDWKDPTRTATAVDAPVFTANKGFDGDGAADYINTNFIPSTDGVNYTQDDFSIYILKNKEASAAAQYALYGVLTAINKYARLCIGNTFLVDANGADNYPPVGGGNMPGHILLNRKLSTEFDFYFNKTKFTRTNNSVGLPTFKMFVLGNNFLDLMLHQPIDDQVSIFALGGSLTDTQMDILVDAVDACVGTNIFNPSTEKEVWVLAGQSNATGWALVTDITGVDYKAAIPNGKIFDKYNDTSTYSQRFEAYDPGVNSQSADLKFGVENSFLKNLSDYRSGEVYLIKDTQNGTYLAQDVGSDDWNVNSDHELLWRLKTNIYRGLYELRSDGIKPKIKGFIWIQGESDAAGTAEQYNAYEANLTAFMADIVSYMNTENTKGGFTDSIIKVIGRAKTHAGAGWTAVQNAQDAYCTASGAINMSTEAYTLQGDNSHFTADSLVQYGIDIYNAVKDL